MRVFFRCVAEAVAENGLKGLAQMVPGGPFACAVAESAWRKYRERCALAAQQRELQELAEAKLEDARAEVVGIVREVFAAVPVGPDEPLPFAEELLDAEQFLASIPDAVRQSLKRADDPTGRSVPHGFALRSADDVLRLLPARPPRFRPGDALPGKSGWVLDRLLGMGGFGEVWFTRHARMTSLSGAVKFCFGQSGRDLIHEAGLIDRVMTAGRHPNIVPLLDVHLEGDRPWLLFEYVAGGNLTDWIHRLAGRPPAERLPQVLAALRQLCGAVATFHGLPVPIVHRDLKPSNILLDEATQTLRITDFGIGSITATETNRQESRTGMSRGGRLLTYLRGSCTPLYSSPQQRLGGEPDPRDDVHALGVIAYQMLTGKFDAAPGPAAGKTLKAAGVGADLAELLLGCVSEHVEDRPKDAAELLAQLPKRLDAEPLRAVAEPKAEPPKPVRVNEPPANPNPGEVFTLQVASTEMRFAWIPSGTFLMGGNGVYDNPQHRVTISKGFWMGVTPVTQYEWRSVMGFDHSRFKGDDLPVEHVSWDDCQEFCRRLGQLSKKPIRLPTEAEWEYACRAGSAGEYCNGGGEAALQAVGWYKGNSGGTTHPVGRLAPNAWGLQDIHGNVWEWCEDWYGDISTSIQTDPTGPTNGDARILRGGSWAYEPNFCLASRRDRLGSGCRGGSYGLRVLFRLEG